MAQKAHSKGFEDKYIESTGLCYRTDDGRLLDRYHGRVIFPVHSVSGRIVAFGGRILSTEQKNVGKYVNSPESEIYSKKKELYGLYLAKQAIVKQDRCYLVEGYLDVISMHQSGDLSTVSQKMLRCCMTEMLPAYTLHCEVSTSYSPRGLASK